jgi:hypothetical protein
LGKSRTPAKTAPSNALGKNAAAPTARGKAGGKVAPSVAARKVDLSTLSQEYERRRQIWATFFNTHLVKIDDYAEGRRSQDYVQLFGPNGEKLMYQVQDQTIPNFIEKTIAYITPESVRNAVPFDLNPQMDDECRETVSNVFRTQRDMETLYSDGDPLYERLWAFTVRGTAVKGYEWLADDDAATMQDGWPILTRFADILENAAPLIGANGRVDSVIIGEKLRAVKIPPSELKRLPNGDQIQPYDELDVWYYCDTVQWGRTINNVVTTPLTPHGFRFVDGTPMCPWVVQPHRPRKVRNGSVAPQTSGLSQTGEKIGIPPTYYLLSPSEILSRVATVQMENIRRVGLSTVWEKGRVKRPNDTGLDLTQPTVELDDQGEIGTINYPDVNANADRFTNNIRQNMAAPAGMDNALMSGPQSIPNSAMSASHMTGFVRAAAAQIGISLAHMLDKEDQVVAGMCASKLHASPIDAVQQTLGERLPTTGGADDPLARGTSLPFTGRIAGNAVTDYTFANFRRSKNDVTPDTRMTPEASMQVGSQLLLAKDPQTGKPVLPLPVILTKFFSGIFDAPEEVQRAIEFDKLASLPGSPLAVIEQTEAMINRYAALLGEDQVQQMRQSLLQFTQQKIPAFAMSLLSGEQQPGGQPPPPEPQPQGPPPPQVVVQGQNQPPQGPPPPQGAPMLPGQMPPMQPPGSPMATPMGQMAPGGGNPQAALPPPPQMQGPGPVLG